MKPYLTHLILGTCSSNGIYYLGILRYLYIEKLLEHVKYIAGTSMGAYFCLVFAMKMPVEYIETYIANIFEHANTDAIRISIENDRFRDFFKSNGFFNTDVMMAPLIEYMKNKYHEDDLTFREFVKKTGVNIYISCSCISDSKNKIFSAEDTPDVSILDAVRASISMPFLFKPIVIDNKQYVDGVISDPLTPENIFCNVENGQKLFINLSATNHQLPPAVAPKGEEISFIDFVVRILKIVYASVTRCKCEYKEIHVLDVADLKHKDVVRFYKGDNGKNIVELNFAKSDLDNLVLQGFIDITVYMNKRYKDNMLDIN